MVKAALLSIDHQLLCLHTLLTMVKLAYPSALNLTVASLGNITFTVEIARPVWAAAARRTLLQACQLSRFYRKSHGFSSGLKVSRASCSNSRFRSASPGTLAFSRLRMRRKIEMGVNYAFQRAETYIPLRLRCRCSNGAAYTSTKH